MGDDARETRRREDRLRRRADRQGFALRKSRVRTPNLNDRGGYMLVDSRQNFLVAGHRFNLDLDDVEAFLDDRATPAPR
jgi:hypothetical protein